MAENNDFITNVVIPNGAGTKTLDIKDANALHNAEYTRIKDNVDAIQAKVDELITKLSNMAYNISPDDNDSIPGPDARPQVIGNLNWNQ